MIKNSEAENFICFSTIWEEGPTDLADCLLVEEDDSLGNQETLSERTNLTSKNLEKFQTKKTPGAKLKEPNLNSKLTTT